VRGLEASPDEVAPMDLSLDVLLGVLGAQDLPRRGAVLVSTSSSGGGITNVPAVDRAW
jgi:hypothetical protein